MAPSPAPSLSAIDLRSTLETPPSSVVFDALPHRIAVLDRTGSVVFVNQRWAGAQGDHLLACGVGDNLLTALRQAPQTQSAVTDHVGDGLERVLDGRLPTFELQYRQADDDGGRWFLVSVAALPAGGAVLTHTDTTIHHTVHDVLAELAFHDPLTSLPNRSLLVDRIRMSLIRAQRNASFPAVLFVDLDGFKDVNDSHGHHVGDRVLIEASRRLTSSVREGDTCGRWGGDEFVIVIELADPHAIGGLIDRMQRRFSEPVMVGDTAIDVGLSIGVVVSNAADSVETLLRLADEAMYGAKRSGDGVRVVGLDDRPVRR